MPRLNEISCHIAYWDTFSINGLELISVTDIIKSSVYPILISLFFRCGDFILPAKWFLRSGSTNKEPTDREKGVSGDLGA